MSKLIDGRIPPKTECPFKDRCNQASVCKHNGIEHTCAFSCGLARLFDKVDEGEGLAVIRAAFPVEEK